MTEYHKYLKSWTTERGITSFLGSDKPAFQQDWKDSKRGGVRFGELESMGGDDINRAGEAFKKTKPKISAAEAVFTNPDLLKEIGAFTNPNYLEPPDLEDNIEKYNELLKTFEEMVETYNNPPKRRQTERAKKKRKEEKNELISARLSMNGSYNELISRPLYRYLEKLWILKYGGEPGTNGDKSNFSFKESSDMMHKQLLALQKKYGVPHPWDKAFNI